MPEMFKLVRDVARYGDSEKKRAEYPEAIFIQGTLEQAQSIASSLSFDEPGCTDYWIVEGHE